MDAIPPDYEETALSTIAHNGAARVVVGIDTHKDEHVAVAVDGLGVRLGDHRLSTTTAGYADLEGWVAGLGDAVTFGVEGTGSYGAGLTRFLSSRGHTVIEVNRPDRSTRRRLGKSDPIDAESAARSVLAGTAVGTPKSGTGNVEMIRMLKIARDSAIKARSQAMSQMKSLLVTLPAELRETLDDLPVSKLARRCAGFRPGEVSTITSAAKFTLRSIARRRQQLSDEISALDSELARLTEETAPELVQAFGMGPNTAATLLVTAGDNPERLRSKSAFAALCGVSPIPASSGKTNRHRLNRGGDRRANSALHQIVIVRLKSDERTRSYMERRIKEGKTKLEVIRCLKRYVANEVFHMLRQLPNKDIQMAA